jgi:hypothetical protein
VAMTLIARKRESLSAAAAAAPPPPPGLEGVTTLRTAKQKLDSRPHTSPSMLKLACKARESVTLATGKLLMGGGCRERGVHLSHAGQPDAKQDGQGGEGNRPRHR